MRAAHLGAMLSEDVHRWIILRLKQSQRLQELYKPPMPSGDLGLPLDGE